MRLKHKIAALDTRLGKTAVYYAVHLLIGQEKGRHSKSLMITIANDKWEMWAQAHQYIEDVNVNITSR